VAAAAGVTGAAVAHLLDQTGRLPFVHEHLAVRAGMRPGETAVWLLATAVAAGVASRRPVLFGAPVALLATAAPELLSRHDPGAVLEPGAVVGAAVQLPLLVLVVAVALLLERRLPRLALTAVAPLHPLSPPVTTVPAPASPVRSGAAPRAPPAFSS
jgi:hypothetical protein